MTAAKQNIFSVHPLHTISTKSDANATDADDPTTFSENKLIIPGVSRQGRGGKIIYIPKGQGNHGNIGNLVSMN